MVGYSKMYSILCLAASEAVDLIRERKYAQAEKELLSALNRAEDIYPEADLDESRECPCLAEEKRQEEMFNNIMKAWAEKRGQNYQALNEQLKRDPSAAVPEEVSRRTWNNINKELKNRQSK